MISFAELKHQRAAYVTEGSGEPIVLIHGAESDMRGLASLAAELKKFFTVIRYDQRGCGSTQCPDEGHHIPDLANDVVELMETIGFSRFAVFGTSLGGRIAQAVALLHPEHVSRLVLCNTWPLDKLHAELNPEGHAKLRTLRAALPDTARAVAEMFFTPAMVAAQPGLVDRYATLRADSPRTALAAETHDLGRPPISMPSLLISGSEDAIIPTDILRNMAKQMPASRLVVLPGVGHAAAPQAPAGVAGVIVGFMQST